MILRDGLLPKRCGGLGDTRAIPALINALNDNDDMVRRFAAEALGALDDKCVVPALIDALDDNNDMVRWSVTEALGKLIDCTAVPALIDIFGGNQSIKNKFWAAEALVKLSR